MISVGSSLAQRRKDVAVPFSALQVLEKKHKPHLVLDTTKRALQEARGFKYNRAAKRWEREAE
jgi:hypothetical protein